MNDRTEWNRLMAGFLAGTLGRKEAKTLLSLCRASDERKMEFVRLVGVDRLLTPCISDPGGELTTREVISRIEAGRFGSVEEGWKVFGNLRRSATLRRRAVLACVAMFALLFVGFWFVTPRLAPVAVIAREESIIYVDGKGIVDGEIPIGTRLRALSGLLELRLVNGAKIVLEGPFDIEFQSVMKAILHSGRLVANCPPSAQGFTVITSEGKVVDRGTEFGVQVNADGATEVHVLEGMVEMTPGKKGTYSLFEGEALEIIGKKVSLGRADASAFVTAFPDRSSIQGGYVHWGFDESGSDWAADSGEFLAMGADSRMRLGENGINAPTRVKGVHGNALSFDGVSAFAESGYLGVEGALPRTVAMWLRLPEGDETAGMGLISWGSASEDGIWQISVNWNDDVGSPGRLRVGTFKGRIVGTTNLCDGKWHHIAVVLGSSPRYGETGNVLFYVDGKLEPTSVRRGFRVDTNLRQAQTGVTIGKHSVPTDHDRNFFKGEMDEIFIFDRPLVQDQISSVMETHVAP